VTDPNDPQLLREISRGEQAKRLLDNPLLQEAFTTIRASLHEKFAASPAADREAREEIYRLLKVTGELERHLKTALETGKLAETQRESLLSRVLRRRA
jgi:protein involved in temperature-dependent protein secretion